MCKSLWLSEADLAVCHPPTYYLLTYLPPTCCVTPFGPSSFIAPGSKQAAQRRLEACCWLGSIVITPGSEYPGTRISKEKQRPTSETANGDAIT